MASQTSSLDSVTKKPRYRFRGPYKKHPKPISPYKILAETYEKIAEFYPIWSNKTRDCQTNFFGLRLWQRVYPHERVKGKIRCINEAEIIGSENLYVEDRLSLHQKLLSALENGTKLAEAMKDVQQELKKLQKPRIGEFALWLRQLHG